MTISYRWLQQYIDIPETPEQLAEVLTSTGLEVERISPQESVKGGLRGLVVGEVITCKKHPNADRLSLTTVDVGQERHLAIVCGAPNVAVGQKVIVALPGTTLYPFSGEPFVIKSSKIRGEASEGMICAEDEIGLGPGHDGILVLKTSLANGSPASTYFQLETDYTIEIGLTPNRADAASHLGVARDVKAALKREVRKPSVDAFKTQNKDLIIPVTVHHTESCPRYSAVTLQHIKVSESPDWLKKRLTSIGLTPINNVVDITNFVCHETGQPLHAFDAAAITGNAVEVKMLPAGTKFTTLDNRERSLTAYDLMICNKAEGMCIAGVFGGLHSGITEKTTSLFLESACFAPEFIRKTSMHHQLVTDASFRFARGTDPEGTLYALKRAALLIQELAGGTISSDVVDIYPRPATRRSIVVKDKNVDRLIGKKIPRETVFSILESLDIAILEKKQDQYTVSIPTYRVEVLQEADVIEEILRIYGFNNVALSEITGAEFLAAFPENDPDKFRRNLGLQLAGQGFYEILTNSLTHADYEPRFGIKNSGAPVEILNKLSEDQGILRQRMVFTGLEVVAHNFNRQQKALKFFEFGKTYAKEGTQFTETEHLSLYLSGDAESENWQRALRSVTYHDTLQAVSGILERCGVKEPALVRSDDPIFDYGMRILQGTQEMGHLGKVKSAITREFGIRQDVFFADLYAGLLFQKSNPKFEVTDIPRFPEVRRDLSLVLDQKVTFDDIRKLVSNTEKKLIRRVNAFDVYQGDNIPSGKKAYALGFILLDETKTLTDEEIDRTMNKLMTAFETQLGAVIRK